jgi:hypothetical protein
MTNKATVHLFSARKIGYNARCCDGPPSIESIESTYPGFTAMMKRGDIIENVDEPDYRSSTIYFFDGIKIIRKDTSTTDDYGSPPLEFELITEFPPGYWDCSYYSDSDSKLYINNHFEPNSKSDFYWHSECAWSPIDLRKLGIQGCELTENEDDTYYYCVFIHNATTYFLIHDSPRLPQTVNTLFVYKSTNRCCPVSKDAICISTMY